MKRELTVARQALCCSTTVLTESPDNYQFYLYVLLVVCTFLYRE